MMSLVLFVVFGKFSRFGFTSSLEIEIKSSKIVYFTFTCITTSITFVCSFSLLSTFPLVKLIVKMEYQYYLVSFTVIFTSHNASMPMKFLKKGFGDSNLLSSKKDEDVIHFIFLLYYTYSKW